MPMRRCLSLRKKIHRGGALLLVFFCFLIRENFRHGGNKVSVECFTLNIRSMDGSTTASRTESRTAGRPIGPFGLDRVKMGVASPRSCNFDDKDVMTYHEQLTKNNIEQRIVERNQRRKQHSSADHLERMPWGGSFDSSLTEANDEDEIIEEGNDEDDYEDDEDEEDEQMLSDEQSRALSLIKGGRNVFLTGVAGTGKSLVLKKALEHIKQNFDYNEYVAVAPTGSTAVVLEGQTVHSFAGIGIPKIYTDFGKMKSNKKIRKRWENLKVLLIDEVSMISGEFFDSLSRSVSEIRNDPRPFGGIQLIVCGDFLQLSPIAPRKWEVEQMVTGIREKEGLETAQEARNWLFLNRGFCFQSEAWEAASFETVELKHVFRQSNRDFVNILQDIRLGNVTSETVRYLRENCERPLPQNDFGVQPTILHSKNVNVARENLIDLEKLAGETVTFEAFDKVERERGAGKWVERDLSRNSFFKTCTAEKHLRLKLGAQVMLIKNIGNHNSKLTNGSRGTVVGFRAVKQSSDSNLLPGVEKYPVVQFKNGLQMVVTPQKFQSRILGMGTCTRTAIPLKLAWAITTHKAQGMTMDYVIADVGQVFAEAQLYVALSRVSDQTGLELRNFSTNRVKTNPLALKFHTDPNLEYPFWWDLDGSDPKIMSETKKHIRVDFPSSEEEFHATESETALDEQSRKKQTVAELQPLSNRLSTDVDSAKELLLDEPFAEELFFDKFSSDEGLVNELPTEESISRVQNPFWWLSDESDPHFSGEESQPRRELLRTPSKYSESPSKEQIIDSKPKLLNKQNGLSASVSEQVTSKPIESPYTTVEEQIVERKSKPMASQIEHSGSISVVQAPKPKLSRKKIEYTESILDKETLQPKTTRSSKLLEYSQRTLEEQNQKAKRKNWNKQIEYSENISEEQSLKKKTVVELKAILRERGLKVSGRKAELIERLTTLIQFSQVVLEEHILKKNTVVDLKEMLRDRGLKVSGRKAELIERLMSMNAWMSKITSKD